MRPSWAARCCAKCCPSRLRKASPHCAGKVSDRAILRALHFFDENQRVGEQVDALKKGDIDEFFRLIIASGESSWKLLQNVYVAGSTEEPLALALEMSRRMLEGKGAWRIHGGGFAGAVLHVRARRYAQNLHPQDGGRVRRA